MNTLTLYNKYLLTLFCFSPLTVYCIPFACSQIQNAISISECSTSQFLSLHKTSKNKPDNQLYAGDTSTYAGDGLTYDSDPLTHDSDPLTYDSDPLTYDSDPLTYDSDPSLYTKDILFNARLPGHCTINFEIKNKNLLLTTIKS